MPPTGPRRSVRYGNNCDDGTEMYVGDKAEMANHGVFVVHVSIPNTEKYGYAQKDNCNKIQRCIIWWIIVNCEVKE